MSQDRAALTWQGQAEAGTFTGYAPGIEPPVTDKQLMYQLSPKDLGLAIGTILGLRSQFYHVPGGEPEDKSKEEDSEKKT